MSTYPFCGHCGWDVQKVDNWTNGQCDACGADVTFNAIAVATTASAGTPGSWDAELLPNTVAEATAQGITASPTSDWTTGQSVVLGDGVSEMHYDTAAWVAGQAS